MAETEGGWAPPRRLGLIYNPQMDAARELANALQSEVRRRGLSARTGGTAELRAARAIAEEADLVICVGGDGTVLRCARLALGLDCVIFGVNMGRLGFLTEIDRLEVWERLDEVLRGAGRIESRAMVEATVPRTGDRFHALNEAVVGRATLSRAIQLAVDIDGVRVADYRCDAVIVATATGSTAYALSVGGPILHPESRDLVMVPVAPHLAARNTLVLPPGETVRITLEQWQEAALSLDGEPDLALHEGDVVSVKASPYSARFLRLGPRTDFYRRMAAQLGWHRPAGGAQPLPGEQEATGNPQQEAGSARGR
jgi:NAD+ kinase